jgi:hypothetical protein
MAHIVPSLHPPQRRHPSMRGTPEGRKAYEEPLVGAMLGTDTTFTLSYGSSYRVLELVKELSSNRQLAHLGIDEVVGVEGVRELAQGISGNAVLRTLKIGTTSLPLHQLSDTAKVEEVDLSALRTSHLCAVAIAEFVLVNTTLRSLNLDGFGLPVKQLKGTDPVPGLDLAGKALSAPSTFVIARCLEQNASLLWLDLSQNEIAGGFDEMYGVQALAEALKVNGVLTELNLQKNNLTTTTSTGFVNASKLGGRRYHVGDTVLIDGLQMIVSTAPDRDNDVKLRSMPVRAGIDALTAALRVNTALTSVDVGYNYLDEAAALGIVQVVSKRDKICSLGLAVCGIGPDGAMEIAEYLRVSKALASLDLYHNRLGPSGGAALVTALKSNFTITSLNLKENGVIFEDSIRIEQAVRANRQVKPDGFHDDWPTDSFRRRSRLPLSTLPAALRPVSPSRVPLVRPGRSTS